MKKQCQICWEILPLRKFKFSINLEVPEEFVCKDCKSNNFKHHPLFKTPKRSYLRPIFYIRPKIKSDRLCKHCGELLVRKVREQMSVWERRKFCNQSCNYHHKRAINPNTRKIVQMVEVMKMSEVAKRLNISTQRVSQLAQRADREGLIDLRAITLPRKQNAIKIADLYHPAKYA